MKLAGILLAALLSFQAHAAVSYSGASSANSVQWGPLNSALVVAGGGLLLNNASAACGSSIAGSLRWNGSAFQGCNGSAWGNLVSSAAAASGDAWYIDANLAGGTPSLGVAEVAAQVEIVNGDLTLTPKTGSAAAGVMCQTTNAADTPSTSATTCDAGDESVGLSFAVPAPGIYEVCSSFTHNVVMDQQELLNTDFELVETPVAAQTITAHGGNGFLTGFQTGDAAGGNQGDMYPINLCSVFNWSAKSIGAIVGIRLFYTQTVAATSPNTSIIIANGNPAWRVINFKVRQL